MNNKYTDRKKRLFEHKTNILLTYIKIYNIDMGDVSCAENYISTSGRSRI